MLNIKKLIKTYTPVEWTVFGIIASTVAWWPLWAYALYGKATYHIVLGYLQVGLLFVLLYKQHRLQSQRSIVVTVIMLLYFFVFQIFNVYHFSYILICLSFGLALSLRKEECNNVILLLTKFLSLSIAISLPFFLVHIFVYPLPVFQIMDISWWKGGDEVIYENHFFFISSPSVMGSFRFYSLFDEPGTLGTISAFILWANHYNFKEKDNIIILLGAIFTFSLAFYALFVIGWVTRKKMTVSTIFLSFLGLASLSCLIFYTLQDFEGFETSIINRITDFNEETVDSRLGDDMNIAWDSFIQSGNVIFGLGSGATLKYTSMTSYKSFIIEYGFFGLGLLLWAYKSMIKRFEWLIFFTALLFLASYLQRADLFTVRNVFLFSCIINKFYLENEFIKYRAHEYIRNID